VKNNNRNLLKIKSDIFFTKLSIYLMHKD